MTAYHQLDGLFRIQKQIDNFCGNSERQAKPIERKPEFSQSLLVMLPERPVAELQRIDCKISVIRLQ